MSVPEATKAVFARQSNVAIRLGKQLYTLDIRCQTGVFPSEEPASSIETKVLRFRKPMALRECIDG